MARLHHIAASPAAVQHHLGLGASDELKPQHLLLAAKTMGLKAKIVQSSAERLSLCPLPALARMLDGRWVLLAQCDGQRVLMLDVRSTQSDAGLEEARPTIEPQSLFVQDWSGELLLATSQASLAGELAKFDFSWFVPSIAKTPQIARRSDADLAFSSAICAG